jgi:ParB family transcriptional regulator, chromosome partitioning protein
MKKPITWFRPDENQPRTHFNQESINALAQTIKNIGIINPIEVDPTGMIITGERRYRAMKIAGLQELEEGKHFVINHNPMNSYERLERQMIENIQQSSIDSDRENMDVIDAAEGYRDMLKEHQRNVDSDERRRHGGRDYGITFLAGRLGINEIVIRRGLKLLEESVPLKKAIRRGDITKSEGMELMLVKDKEAKQVIEERLLKGELRGTQNIRTIAKTLREHPEKRDQIVKIKFDDSANAFKEFANALNRFSWALKKIRLSDINDPMFHHLAEGSVKELVDNCKAWLKDETVDIIDVTPE